MMNTLSITDNEFLRQFECSIEGELVKIEYSEQERKIFLTKLVMSESLRNKGYLDLFIEQVLEIIKDRNIRVMPTNPAIAKFMSKKLRRYNEILTVGINN